MTTQLEVLCLEACPGQRLALSGASPAFGAWDPARAIPLTSNSQGLWSATVPHQEVNAKFKLLILNADGSLAAWEPLKHTRKWPVEATAPGTRLRAKYGKKRMKVDKGRTGSWLDGLTAFLGCCLAPEQDRRMEMDFGSPQMGQQGPSDGQQQPRDGPAVQQQAKKASVQPPKTEPEEPPQAAAPPPPPAKKVVTPAGRNEPEAVAPKSPPPGPGANQAAAPPVPVQPSSAATLPAQQAAKTATIAPEEGEKAAVPAAPERAPEPQAAARAAPAVSAPQPKASTPTLVPDQPHSRAKETLPPPAAPATKVLEVPAAAEKAAAPVDEIPKIVVFKASPREPFQPWREAEPKVEKQPTPFARKPSVATWLQAAPCVRPEVRVQPEKASSAEVTCKESLFDFVKPSAKDLPVSSAAAVSALEAAPTPARRSVNQWARMPSVATWSTTRIAVREVPAVKFMEDPNAALLEEAIKKMDAAA